MISVVILGNGNVATHLYNAFLKAENIAVSKINSRKLESIPIADVTIIAVSDDAIADVSKSLNNRNGLITHTSGAVDIDVIVNERKGVFYPLQSFSKDKSVDFKTIPFCLETSNSEDYNLLEKLAKSIGNNVFQISSEQRKKLHVAAVFVNNFSNHMYKIAHDICEKNDVPFEILYPLIEETAKKIQSISPENAQTGPAKRNDVQTIENHLENLNLQQQKIYKLLSKSIQEN